MGGKQLRAQGIQAADFLSSQGAVGLKAGVRWSVAEENALLIEVISAAQSLDGWRRSQQAARRSVLESAPLSFEVSSRFGKGSMLASFEMSTCHN